MKLRKLDPCVWEGLDCAEDTTWIRHCFLLEQIDGKNQSFFSCCFCKVII